MAYTLVNNATGTVHLDGANPSFNMATAPTGGNLVVVTGAAGGLANGCSDNHGNNFTLAAGAAGTGIGVSIYYLRVPSSYGGTYTIQFDSGGATVQVTCSATEFAGCATTVDPKDQSSTNTGSSTTPTTAATPTNGAYASLAIIACGMTGYNPIWGFTDPTGGWTDMYFEIHNESYWTGAGCYRLTTDFASTTLPAQQWTGGEDGNWAACAATFKDTGADGGAAPPRRRSGIIYF